MNEEPSLQKAGTWEMVALPLRKATIGSKWFAK